LQVDSIKLFTISASNKSLFIDHIRNCRVR
jgi:hypothetical protein